MCSPETLLAYLGTLMRTAMLPIAVSVISGLSVGVFLR